MFELMACSCVCSICNEEHQNDRWTQWHAAAEKMKCVRKAKHTGCECSRGPLACRSVAQLQQGQKVPQAGSVSDLAAAIASKQHQMAKLPRSQAVNTAPSISLPPLQRSLARVELIASMPKKAKSAGKPCTQPGRDTVLPQLLPASSSKTTQQRSQQQREQQQAQQLLQTHLSQSSAAPLLGSALPTGDEREAWPQLKRQLGSSRASILWHAQRVAPRLAMLPSYNDRIIQTVSRHEAQRTCGDGPEQAEVIKTVRHLADVADLLTRLDAALTSLPL